jgi:hypothetical protein
VDLGDFFSRSAIAHMTAGNWTPEARPDTKLATSVYARVRMERLAETEITSRDRGSRFDWAISGMPPSDLTSYDLVASATICVRSQPVACYPLGTADELVC